MMSISPTPSPYPYSQACSLWRSRLGAALRTALACTAVGVATVYGPEALRRQAKFPAFSYVTVILVVREAALGDAINGAVSALYGTVLGVLPAMLTLFLIRPEIFSIAVKTLAVSLSSFMVALPESTSLIAMRIALGQIVIIYSAILPIDEISGHDKSFMLPVHVAVSTAIGVVASLLALLFPYPRLAFYEVRKKRKLYKEMATERLMLLVNAFCAEDPVSSVAFTSRAKSLKLPSTKLLQAIILKQARVQWEMTPFQSFPSHFALQEVEAALQGMEVALTSSIPVKFLNNDSRFKRDMVSLRNHLILKLLQDHNLMARRESFVDYHLHFPSMPHTVADLPPFFFLFCLHLLHVHCDHQPITTTTAASSAEQPGEEKKIMPTTEQTESSCRDENPNPSSRFRNWFLKLVSYERFLVASKCSLSVGLAVIFGALFSRDNGLWSGLSVAITITPWREATFRLANLRAQGTTLGSVYGVLGALISQNLMELRFLVLLPWIIFTSFLQRSRMYGPSGAIAAVVSAILILGRRNYGSPTTFAITRLVETFIGFTCSIFVELILNPTRASTLAREQLRRSFAVLAECMEHSLSPSTSSVAWRVKEKMLRQQVSALKKCIGEADAEPNFWFVPFPVACYNKLHCSMSKMVELLSFLVKCKNLLEEEEKEEEIQLGQEGQSHYIRGDQEIEKFKKLICSSLKCIEEIIQVKSQSRMLAAEKTETIDIEAHAGRESMSVYASLGVGQEEFDKIVASYIQNANEVLEIKFDVDEGGGSKSKLVLYFATLGFCMDGMMRETRELEKGILELLQSENPGKHINLHGISR